jgi:hypothetical protein
MKAVLPEPGSRNEQHHFAGAGSGYEKQIIELISFQFL